jgi:hypothetical protein
MKKLLSLFLIFSVSVIYSQNVNPAPYCASQVMAGCTQNHISNFRTAGAFANISNPTGCSNIMGYMNFCNQYFAAMPGTAMTATVNVFTPSIMGVRCWIDWDQNSIFDPAEQIGVTPTQITNFFAFSFSVPMAQASGNYKLRLKAVNFLAGPSIDPCTPYTAGETEDYLVVIGLPSPGPTTITASSQSVCAGTTVSLTAIGAGPFSWSNGWFGANSYVAPGSNTVVYVSVPNGQCISVNAVSISVIPAPPISIFASTNNVCMGSTVNLIGFGGTSYTWNPGAITGSNIVLTPTVNTSYTLIGSANSCTAQNVVNINVGPNLSAYAFQPSVCAGSNASLVGVGCSTYTWNPGNITGATVVVNPTVSSTYTVSGTAAGCTTTFVVNQSVDPLPVLILSSNNDPSCPNAAVTLSASGANTFTWTQGGNNSTVAISPSVQTIYTLTGSDGTCTATSMITQSILPTPTVTALSNTNVICSGSSATLTAGGAPSYLWSNGNSSSTIVISPSVTTTYTLTGILVPCTGSTTITQSVNPTPAIVAQSNSTMICLGNSATLTASGANNFTWTPGGTGSLVVVSPTTTATYTVDGESSGCLGSTVITQSVSPCTSVAENIFGEQLIIYPNPFSDQVSIETKTPIEISIYDAVEKKVYFSNEKINFTINTTEWPKGIYFLKLKSGEGNLNYKLVKN